MSILVLVMYYNMMYRKRSHGLLVPPFGVELLISHVLHQQQLKLNKLLVALHTIEELGQKLMHLLTAHYLVLQAEAGLAPVHKKKCFVIFGKVVTKNSRWLFEDALTLKNARTELLNILDRTRDDTADRLQDTLVDRATEDDINECSCY